MTPSALFLVLGMAAAGLTAADAVPHAAHAAASWAMPAAPLATRGPGESKSIPSIIRGMRKHMGPHLHLGRLEFPHGFPIGSRARFMAKVHNKGLEPLPTQVLNIPAYGNWTDQGWSVRVHGNVYKLPRIKQERVDLLASAFLRGTDMGGLQPWELEQARNVTRSIFVMQQHGVQVSVDFENDASAEPGGAAGGAVKAQGGAQLVVLPRKTTAEGDFDVFVELKNTSGPSGTYMAPGNETSRVQVLGMHTRGTTSGNATAYLVPPKGITVISDIDDILRVTKIYQPREGLLNTFGRAFRPWGNMPDIYANWSSSFTDMHFHYLTTTPEQVTRNYMDFIYNRYPPGSFDTRPLIFRSVSTTTHIRRFLLDKIFQTFPQRRFILVADTSNPDVMKAYPLMYRDYPGQVLCILLRNTSSTDAGDKFPYNTHHFFQVPKESYMFFNVPDDLMHLDIANGQCLNKSIPQNVTFGLQGLPHMHVPKIKGKKGPGSGRTGRGRGRGHGDSVDTAARRACRKGGKQQQER